MLQCQYQLHMEPPRCLYSVIQQCQIISQRYYKFFWVLWTGVDKHIKTIKKVVLTCRKFWCLLACKKSISSSLFSWDKILHSCYFEHFKHTWLHPSALIVPIFWIIWCLSTQKWTLSITSSSRYCKDFENLLFWVIWARPATLTNIDSINL